MAKQATLLRFIQTPQYGNDFSKKITWRWTYWSASLCASLCVQIICQLWVVHRLGYRSYQKRRFHRRTPSIAAINLFSPKQLTNSNWKKLNKQVINLFSPVFTYPGWLTFFMGGPFIGVFSAPTRTSSSSSCEKSGTAVTTATLPWWCQAQFHYDIEPWLGASGRCHGWCHGCWGFR